MGGLHNAVLAGLVPATHAEPCRAGRIDSPGLFWVIGARVGVGDRDKPGQDG